MERSARALETLTPRGQRTVGVRQPLHDPMSGLCASAPAATAVVSVPNTGAAIALANVENALQSGASSPYLGFYRAWVWYLFTQGCICVFGRGANSPQIQEEWAALQRAKVVSKSTKMKKVLLQCPFVQIMADGRGEPRVRLLPDSGFSALLIPQSPSSLAQPAGAMRPATSVAEAAVHTQSSQAVSVLESSGARLINQGSQEIGSRGMSREQVSAIEAHLRRAGGRDRLSRVGSLFDLTEQQLAVQFCLSPSGGDPWVLLGASGSTGSKGVSNVLSFKKTKKAKKGSGASGVGRPTNDAFDLMMHALDLRLTKLSLSRSAIGDTMAFCIDHAEQYASPFARRLAVALGQPELSTSIALARIFLISDILHNSNCGKPGAAHFRMSFQDFLPEAFEEFGRIWFRRIDSHIERARGELNVRRVFRAWEDWHVFPPLYVKGLEALMFAPVQDTGVDDAQKEADLILRAKLLRWFTAADQVRLQYVARLRGLSGKALATASCRARLCHFDRYWHRPGVRDPDLEQNPFETADSASSVAGDDAATAIESDKIRPHTNHLAPGVVVRIKRLKKADATLNNSLATCGVYDAVAGCWTVCVENGELKAIRPENLLPLSAPGAPTSPSDADDDSLDGESLSDEELAECFDDGGAETAPLQPSSVVLNWWHESSARKVGRQKETSNDFTVESSGDVQMPPRCPTGHESRLVNTCESGSQCSCCERMCPKGMVLWECGMCVRFWRMCQSCATDDDHHHLHMLLMGDRKTRSAPLQKAKREDVAQSPAKRTRVVEHVD